jgi:ATP-dependent Zn protease
MRKKNYTIHEAGQGVSKFLPNADPVHKISINAETSGGYTLKIPK